jgi:hypothetical protein
MNTCVVCSMFLSVYLFVLSVYTAAKSRVDYDKTDKISYAYDKENMLSKIDAELGLEIAP